MNLAEPRPELGMIFKDRSKLPTRVFLVTNPGKNTVRGIEVIEQGKPNDRTFTLDEFALRYPLVMWRP